jgi:Fe-S-cluster containining protein
MTAPLNAAAALGIKTGNPDLDAFLAVEVPRLVRLGHPVFVGEDAGQRLDRARRYVEQLLQLAKQQAAEALGKTIACGNRCPACCLYADRVDILPLELRRILDLVERQGRLGEVARRAELRRARGKGACPLLSRNGQCTVYAERPLSCGRYHSLDRDACRQCARDDGNTKVPWIPQVVAAGLALMVLAKWGPAQPVDLFGALPVAAAARLRQAKKRQRRARRAAA